MEYPAYRDQEQYPKILSAALAELINISNTATWHKANCNDPNCNISIYQLGMTAKRLIDHCWMSEKNRARKIIAETDWI